MAPSGAPGQQAAVRQRLQRDDVRFVAVEERLGDAPLVDAQDLAALARAGKQPPGADGDRQRPDVAPLVLTKFLS